MYSNGFTAIATTSNVDYGCFTFKLNKAQTNVVELKYRVHPNQPYTKTIYI